MLAWVRAALVLVALLFVPGLRDSFEPPKAAVVRAAGLALLVYVATARRRGAPPRRTGMDAAIAAWLAIEALATLASRSPLVSAIGEPMQREGLVTSLGLAGWYVATRATHGVAAAGDDAAAGDRAIGTLGWAIAAMTVAALYALAQGAGWDVFRWTGSAVYGPGGAIERPSATFGHPNLLGVAGAAAAAAALALAIAAPRRRAAFAIAAPVIALATLATLSRAAWLGLAIGAAIGAVLAVRAATAVAGANRRGVMIGGAIVVAGGALAAMGWGARLAARFADLLAPTGGSGASRIEIWRAALAAWRARPWLGQGPDTFALVFHRFQTAAYWRVEWAGLPYHAHSVVLHALATRGLLGAAVMLGACVSAALAARRAWRARPASRAAIAAIVAALVAVAVAGQLGAFGTAGALWMVLGAALLASLGGDDAATPDAAPERRPPLFALAAAAIVAFAMAALGVADIASSGAARAADLALARAREGDAAARLEARDAAIRAARRSPWDDAYPRLEAEADLGVAVAGGDAAA
ncbi:MAG: O-antigen ligase family protein, partial [Candidatus Eisenbacteria bacterium]|nr:O-antigen ligase family protein [Candidatus Eisenbacteria bacterium]